MQSKKEKNKIGILLRILEIFDAYQEISAGRILEILTAEGYFPTEKKVSAKRRLLNYYLSELEQLGYIELKGRGRAARWVLKKSFIKDECFLIENQKTLMLLGLLFSDEPFLNSTLPDWKRLMAKLEIGPTLLSHISLDIGIKNLWGLNFGRCLPIISKVVEAIRERSYISVLFKDEKKYQNFLPVGLGARQGFLYIIALEETGTRRFIPIQNISYITLKKKQYKGKKFPYLQPYLCFPNEQPFIFGLELQVPVEQPKNISFTKLIFHTHYENGILKRVYMVGFTGDYFANRFLPFLSYRLIPPNEEMLYIALRKEIDKKISNISTALEENKKRFKEFLLTLNRLIDYKKGIINTALNLLN